MQQTHNTTEKGSISIDSENMLPIIKKWLYSDKDIFIRELISNACDAITKYNKLVSLGEASKTEILPRVDVSIDEKEQTLTFSDNGIGMDAEEVRKYINQVAFSGAKDFIEKYEQSESEAIIGHFGLGFYSAFMVSKKVEIKTKSFKEDSAAVLWKSDGGTQYSIEQTQKQNHGTEITLFLQENELEYLQKNKVEQVIQKYCAFLPYPIYLTKKQNQQEQQSEQTSEQENLQEKQDEQIEKPINNIAPLWNKNAAECTDEEYKEFYHTVFNTMEDPIFWIHLNVDYPFKLKGILFFPHYNRAFDALEGEIKLYNNQVFVADNVKEVIPEFMLLLRGVIDCPDLPLNVSRSFLQNDGTVRKLQTHITKKVGDKLKNIFNNQREDYDKFWPDINPFIKYGALKDEKFFEMIKDFLIFEKLDKKMWTMEEIAQHAKNNGGKIYYVSDKFAQAFYIDLFEKQNQEAIIMDTPLDNHFISFLEYKNPSIAFGRIDSEIADAIKGEYDGQEIDSKIVSELMQKSTGKPTLVVEIAPLKTKDLPAMLVVDEQMRRMFEMTMRNAPSTQMPFEIPDKLVLNSNNEIIQTLASLEEERKELVASYVYDIALLTRGMLKADDVKKIVEHSNSLLKLVLEIKN